MCTCGQCDECWDEIAQSIKYWSTHTTNPAHFDTMYEHYDEPDCEPEDCKDCPFSSCPYEAH